MKNYQSSLCWAECWKVSLATIVQRAPRQSRSKLPAEPVRRCKVDLKLNIRHRYTPQQKFRVVRKVYKEKSTLSCPPNWSAHLIEGLSCDWLLPPNYFSAQGPLIR